MRYLLVLAFWSIGITAHAQHLSAGLRGSAGISLQRHGSGTKAGLKPIAGNPVSVAPEAFLRYQGRKCWAAEFAITADRMQQQYWWAGAGSVQTTGFTAPRFNTRSIEAAMNLQYEIRSQRNSQAPGLRKLHSYVGIGTSLARIQQQGFVLAPGGETTTQQNSEYWYHWISLSQTLRYDVNRNFSLQTGGQCGMNTMPIFRAPGVSEPALRFSVQLGASYNW